MNSSTWLARLVIVCLTVSAIALGATRTLAAEDKAEPKQKESAKNDKAAQQQDEEEDYTVADGSPEEILKGIEQLKERENKLKGKTRQEKIKEFVKIQEAVIEAADRILNNAQAGEEVALTAAKYKLQGLNFQARLGQDGAEERYVKALEALRGDKRAKVAAEASFALAKQQLNKLDNLSEDEQRKLLGEIEQYLAGQPHDREHLVEAMQVGQTLEDVAPKLAAEAYTAFAKIYSDSSEPAVREYAAKFEGSARRANLPGNFMEIAGHTVAGETFDWSSYRGKVVLVDFWATWCGPCVGELPNVKKNYQLYHDRGFEVVGISLDDDRKDLEAFIKKEQIPWTNLFPGEGAATGWDNPIAAHYGINAIPAVFLVDKEGKVVSMNARGEKLGEELAKLLGPAEGDDQDKSDAKGE